MENVSTRDCALTVGMRIGEMRIEMTEPFTDEDIAELKNRLTDYGVDSGIDVCNYFDYPSDISALLNRLETAEKVVSLATQYSLIADQIVPIGEAVKDWKKSCGRE